MDAPILWGIPLMQNRKSTITETTSIRDILDNISFDSIVVLDLDNTTITSSSDLGGESWFGKLIEHTSTLTLDKKESIGLVITVYNAVQYHIKAKPVEPNIVTIIKRLQDLGLPVIALTARGKEIIEPTLRQLDENGIHFDEDNIIFCDGGHKGDKLAAYLKQHSLQPGHILMVDDKKKHLDHVKESVEKLSIRFHGLRYGLLDQEIDKHDMTTAHAQLAHIKKHLPSDAQKAIEKLNLIPSDLTLSECKLSKDFILPEKKLESNSHTTKNQHTLFSKKRQLGLKDLNINPQPVKRARTC